MQFLNSELSSNCEGYAKPSLCYSVFPICRDLPINKKPNKSEVSTQLFNLLNSHREESPDDSEDDGNIDELTRPLGLIQKRSTTFLSNSKLIDNPSSNSFDKKKINHEESRQFIKNKINQRLRRICREECEMLENELCRKEYAIAKRHPQIGQQVPLVECSDLPLNNTEEAIDCLSLGISTEINVQKGKHYMIL